ncbi:MAG: hypothetical protein ABIK38_02475, partial [candidate division WOR-3 bacterium]
QALKNAVRLAINTGTLIIDHHLLRSPSGPEWLNRIEKTTGTRTISAAQWQKKEPLLLEANRCRLYTRHSVPVSDQNGPKTGE